MNHTNLPKWARDHIASLERRLEMAEAANAQFVGGVGQPVDSRRSVEDTLRDYGRPEYYSQSMIEVGKVTPLAFADDKPRITLSMCPNRAAWEHERDNRGNRPYFAFVQQPDGSVEVLASGGMLSVEPYSTNVVTLRLRGR